MKRRDLIRYTILSSTSLAGIFHQNFANAKSFELKAAQSKYRWIVLYWMPYDNNLVRFGEQIIEMLIEGTKNSDAIVVVQSDYFGDVHMRRRIIENGIIEQENLEIEDSSNVDTFSAYLDWAFQTFDAEKWAIIIVGHGGRINEISPDNHGFNRQPRTWMEVDQLAREISHFNRSTDNRVELLFLQNCNKATLEVVYEMRNCARYTLASQFTLGAPNYYYVGFLESLNNSLNNGYEAATAIIDSEHTDMYHSLTLINNQMIRQIPEKLSRLTQIIL
ncbi:MAG: clostripain-related cysteine peptidase, partial [Cyanobacteria bacterium J06635_15]